MAISRTPWVDDRRSGRASAPRRGASGVALQQPSQAELCGSRATERPPWLRFALPLLIGLQFADLRPPDMPAALAAGTTPSRM